MKVITQFYTSPYGELILGSFKNQIVLCDWRYRKTRIAIDRRIKKNLEADFIVGESETISLAISQLEKYFQGKRMAFSVPLKMLGTEFQKKVWNGLLKIPFGQAETYLSLSKQLGNEKAIRAVAAANGANAISILIPCHRVIGSNHSLVGYAGGLTAKRKLLELESPILFLKQTSLFK